MKFIIVSDTTNEVVHHGEVPEGHGLWFMSEKLQEVALTVQEKYPDIDPRDFMVYGEASDTYQDRKAELELA